MRLRSLTGFLVVSLLLALAGRADAKHQIRFAGPHPIIARLGGGYCYIDVPHIHAYAPDRQNLYQQVGDEYVFTGDPTPFGYDGEKHTYYGHHPVTGLETGEPVYCLIDGPHFHAAPPPETPDFKVKGDVAFYIGPPLPVKPARVKLVNAEYRPFVSFRPVVTVEPPPEFHAEVVLPGPPGVVVAPPSVVVDAPHPRVDVRVSAPGVFFAPPSPPSVTVVAPAPPHVVVGAPGVYVGAPGVYVGAPGVAVGPPGVVVEGRGSWKHEEHHEGHWEHHDNGKHKGWYK